MSRAFLITLFVVSMALAGCITSDDVDQTDQDADDALAQSTFPDFTELPETITGIDLLAESDVPTGSGIWLDGDHAYVGARGDGFYVVDISDPTAPETVSHLSGDDVYARDVDLLTFDDGRKVAVLAGQSTGMFFIDVTDPANATQIAAIGTDELGQAVHNVDIVPGTHLIYNAPSGGRGQSNIVVDAADPENPKAVSSWGAYGCHDTTFFVDESENKSRAYCAGVGRTEIWDIADPLFPRLVTSINHPVIDNAAGLHHLAMVNQDASVLMIGDEFTGGLGPGCGATVHSPLGADSTQLGALWLFDITDETEPVEKGNFAPTIPADNHAMAQSTSCTAHFGTMIADRPLVAIGWYAAGTILIDIEDPDHPTEVARFNSGTDTWDARYHRGHVFTGDMIRGLDVLKLV